jgi:thioredoxin reductase
MTPSTERQPFDVIVVGGGAAGLSSALALSRARRSVLVVDAGDPRNARADGVHNYLGREGTPPAELLAIGRTEVEGYGGEVTPGRAVAVHAWPGEAVGFDVELADGRTVRGRRVVVATGLADVLPAVPGLEERFGRDVLHCPYCHGYEVRDSAVGVLADGPFGPFKALLFRQWSDDVTLFLDGGPAPTADELEQLAARDIAVVEEPVASVVVEDDRLTGLRLASGRVVARDAVVVSPRFEARAELLSSLGLEPVEQAMNGHVVGSSVPADPMGATAVPGVWVAGNVADVRAQVISSAAAGLNVGAAVNLDLVLEDTARAVDARRLQVAG